MPQATDARYDAAHFDYVKGYEDSRAATSDQVWDERIATIWAAVVGFVGFTALFRWLDELKRFADSSLGQVVGIACLGAVVFFAIFVIMGGQLVSATAVTAIALAFGVARFRAAFFSHRSSSGTLRSVQVREAQAWAKASATMSSQAARLSLRKKLRWSAVM